VNQLLFSKAVVSDFPAQTDHGGDSRLGAASPTSETTSQASSQALAYRHRHAKWEIDLSVDDDGGVAFHNSTSPIYEPLAQHRRLSTIATQLRHDADLQNEQHIRRDLVLNATHQKQIEPYAVANGAVKSNLPKELSHELMKIHWCWQHPLFLVLYRPSFTRGMAMVDCSTPGAEDPPYFSGTLLKVC
jgi:hypothetical protein